MRGSPHNPPNPSAKSELEQNRILIPQEPERHAPADSIAINHDIIAIRCLADDLLVSALDPAMPVDFEPRHRAVAFVVS